VLPGLKLYHSTPILIPPSRISTDVLALLNPGAPLLDAPACLLRFAAAKSQQDFMGAW
jgi:hypothetical protein